MSPEILSKLREWQRPAAEHLLSVLRNYDSAVDCSDPGVGKTYVAVAVACALNLPTLVVVPKISVTAWGRVAEYFGDKFSVINYEKLRTGNTDFGRWENQDRIGEGRQIFHICQCCQQRVDLENPGACFAHPLGIHCLETKKRNIRYGNFELHPAVKAVIFDEAHRCGGMDSLNAEMLIAAKRQKIKTLCLSATLATDPMKLRAIGYSLDLHGDRTAGTGKPNFFQWAARHGCRRIPPLPGIRWAVGVERQAQAMAAIRSQIIPARGVRLTTDTIPGFPERSIELGIYDLDEGGGINRLYAEMAVAIASLKSRMLEDKAADHPLTELLRARQKVEILKVPVVEELVQDCLEKGLSVAIFVNFKATIDELRRRLKCSCFIDGSAEGCLNRQLSIDEFQANRSRVILANSEAGGISVSLHDLSGQHPRIGLVMPTFSAVTFRQVLGRLHREGAKSIAQYRVIFAARTVEEKIARALKQKLSNLDSLLDGDLTGGTL